MESSDDVLSFAYFNGNKIVVMPEDILQENHYYPFGMDLSGPWMNDAAPDNRYKYNGKEYNDDFGLNWMDYGARWYDGAVGRWWSGDPLAEMNFNESPFVYAGNSAFNNIDIGGLFKLNPKGSYPELENYLRSGDLSRLLQNPDLRNGLKTLGGFSDDQIDEMAIYDEGPEIYIVPYSELGVTGNIEVTGKFRSSDEKGSFFINMDLVNQFKNASPENQQAALLLLISTIFHESVHLGVHKNRLPNTSNHGNWEKRGDIYYFNKQPVGFLEGSDYKSYIRNFPKRYQIHDMTTEDGRTLENVIWGVYLEKMNQSALEESKKRIENEKDKSKIPRA